MNPVVAKALGPGRPKDLEKRAAILEAGKHLFPLHGFEGVSMDAIAQEAGVSKLTVYNHFQDKETLFQAVVKAKCDEQLPHEIFEINRRGPIKAQLLAIGRAFFALITSPEALALHRMMTVEGRQPTKLGPLFWEAGPKRMQDEFANFLRAEIAEGALDVPDPPRAAAHFLCLLKGELHARLLFGCCAGVAKPDADAHIASVVDFFLRAYAPR